MINGVNGCLAYGTDLHNYDNIAVIIVIIIIASDLNPLNIHYVLSTLSEALGSLSVRFCPQFNQSTPVLVAVRSESGKSA
jgi:hypothetical protein